MKKKRVNLGIIRGPMLFLSTKNKEDRALKIWQKIKGKKTNRKDIKKKYQFFLFNL